MNTEFRTKLRVKRWKINAMSQAELETLKQKMVCQQLDKCPRCGVDKNGCRPSPCPHGNWCGIKPEPSSAEARTPGPIFISRLFDPNFMTLRSDQSVWPADVKTEIWN